MLNTHNMYSLSQHGGKSDLQMFVHSIPGLMTMSMSLYALLGTDTMSFRTWCRYSLAQKSVQSTAPLIIHMQCIGCSFDCMYAHVPEHRPVTIGLWTSPKIQVALY